MSKTDKIFVPPIKIQGIKTKIIPLIKSNVTISDDVVWIEPFMGSGAVGFNLKPNHAIFSDINPHLINFYNSLKFGKISHNMIKDFLSEEGAVLSEQGENHYYVVRDRFNNLHNPLDFLFLNRACFNGMIRFNRKGNFNVPYCHKPQRFSKAYITKIVNQVRYVEDCLARYDWQFVCQDFQNAIFHSYSFDKVFIYCDPPYVGRHTDYYDTWNEDKEKNLSILLQKINKPFMVSTWDKNKFRINHCIEKFWGFCNKLTQEHFYHIGGKEVNRHSITEAILMNFK